MDEIEKWKRENQVCEYYAIQKVRLLLFYGQSNVLGSFIFVTKRILQYNEEFMYIIYIFRATTIQVIKEVSTCYIS